MLFRISVNDTNNTYSCSINTRPIPDIIDVLDSAQHADIRDGFVSKLRESWECLNFEQLTNEGFPMHSNATPGNIQKDQEK